MPETPVQVSTASTGAPIMCEQIGTTFVQQVKLLGGQSGSAQPIPGDSNAGLMVQFSAAQPVSVSGVVSITGSIAASISGPVAISGITPVTTQASVSVSGIPVWFAPGASVTVSGQVVTNTGVQAVSGAVSVSALPAVSISGITPVTTQASVSVSGLPVWFAPGASVTVSGMVVTNTGLQSVSGNVVVSGVVSVSAMPAVVVSGITPVTTQTSVSVSGIPVWFAPGASVTISGMVVTITGTQLVSVVPGVSVTISGLPVTISGIVPVTTAASVSVSGIPVWLNPTQAVAVNTIAAGFSVSIGSAVQISGFQGQSVTISGLPVTVSGIVPVTTQTSVSVSGIPVWFAPGALVSVSGTLAVTQAPGLSVTISGQVVTNTGVQAVTVSGIVPVTSAASVSVSGVPVWLNPTQTVLAVMATSGPLLTTAAPSTSATGVVVWVAGVTGVDISTATPGSVATAMVVRAMDVTRIPVLILLSSTVIGSNTTVLMTIFTNNTFVATGTSAWAVPAGRNFRLLNMQVVAQSSAVLGAIDDVQLVLVLGTATASISFTSTVGLMGGLNYAIPSGTMNRYGIENLNQDLAAGTTLCAGVLNGTSHSILGGMINGYLF